MAKKRALKELRALDAQCANSLGLLHTALGNLDIISQTEATRETAMAKTKVDEAVMWLERYRVGVLIEMAAITCI